jgi:Leucine-rich repeat (LRR) protein
MTYISLFYNNLTGEIPDICNCSSLTTILLYENNLTGLIPFSARCQLPYLDTLDLSGNRLVGVIPSSLSNFTNLTMVELNSNFLSGVLPSQICNKHCSLESQISQPANNVFLSKKTSQQYF